MPPNNQWTEDEIEILRSFKHAVAGEVSVALRARGYDRSVSAVRNARYRIEEFREAPVPDHEPMRGAPISDGIDSPVQPPSSSQKLARTSSVIEVYKDIYDSVLRMHQSTKDRRKPIADRRGDFALMGMVGDTHIGELVKWQSEIIFDIDIARQRLHMLTEAFAEEAAFSKKHFGADEILIALPGDLFDGEEVYKTQAHDIADIALGQFKVGLEAFGAMLDRLCSLDMPVRMSFARGNHTIRAERAARASNMDNFLAVALEAAAMRHAWPVKIRYTRDEWLEEELKGQKILIRHISPKPVKTAASSNKHRGWMLIHEHDILVTGHFHETMIEHHHGRWNCRVGSLVGGNELSESMGEHSPPTQLCALVGADPRFWPISL